MPPEYSDDPLNDKRSLDPQSGADGEADLADDDSDVFIYPGAELVANEEEEESDEEFHYPGADEPAVPAPAASAPEPEATAQSIPAIPREPSPVVSPITAPYSANDTASTATATPEEPQVRSRAPEPSRAQLESLYAGASAGDLEGFQKLVNDVAKASECEPFALVNDATSRTGLTPLHAAASRGHLDIVKWLIENCGAIPDLEDKEGETAVHKASLQGHIEIIKYLLPDKSEVHAKDADGWTALHNACSKGYLDIVRWLCEHGGAAKHVDGVPGVDVRSNGGWTPLMNAASKGHLPVVLYLLTKQSADPLVRNNWGETAYDAAAAVFEVWICEVLARFEAEKWRGSTASYDPLSVHTTVPLILYENQRLDMRIKTLAVSGGRPRFTASGLGRHGRRPPFELKLLVPDERTGEKTVGAWRSDVQLPLREDPLKLPVPGSRTAVPEGAERSHFWLSDWTLDVTHPGVDAESGWQFATSFDDPDDQWTPEPPAQLERLLHGTSVMPGLSPSSSSRRSSAGSSSSQNWVRRRRWVRVMRRRLDIPPLPYLGPDGGLYHWLPDGTMVPFEETINEYQFEGEGEDDGQELGAVPPNPLAAAQDYVARARYLAGEQNEMEEGPAEARRAIAKLERATTELRQGIMGDYDPERKTHAEVLLNAYGRELERRRLTAQQQGLLLNSDALSEFEDDDDDDSSFHYPGASPVETTFRDARSVAGRSYAGTDYFGRGTSSRAPTDLTQHLSQAPEFRVPTHEAPQKVVTPMFSPPTPHDMNARWERDHQVSTCRDCQRRFTFILRRHHCRRCGRIFCDRCSSYRTLLDPSDTVHDPAAGESSTASTSQQRVCQSCYEAVNMSVPSPLQGSRVASMERIFIESGRLSVPRVARQSSSQLSDLNECPVCSRNLSELGTASEQEAHVRSCLEGDTSKSPQVARYLVYKLPAESALIGIECVICLEEFVVGSTVARLSCLCSFHNNCLSSWLQRGKSCPVHARDP